MRGVFKSVFIMFRTEKINCQVSCLEHFLLKLLEINKADANLCNSLFVFLIKCVFGGQPSVNINYFWSY